jgi:hypothetical protein
MNLKPLIVIALAIGVGVGSALLSPEPTPEAPKSRPKAYVGFPEALDPACRDGKARLFDECSDQVALFNEARARAGAQGKVLLVELGAEWCIWCHVFEAHVNGEYDRFRYTYGGPTEPEARYTTSFEEGPQWSDAQAAEDLRTFVAANFVIVHIDLQYAPRWIDVLRDTGAEPHYRGGVPFVFTVDGHGRFAGRFDHDAVERRREDRNWYRGYDRRGLIAQLTAMRDAARAQD